MVQQMQGRVEPNVELNGVNINDNDGLEHEADIMGQRAMTARSNDAVGDDEELKTVSAPDDDVTKVE